MKKKLITERDVQLRSDSDPIIIDSNTVITPAALDLATLKAIPIRYEQQKFYCKESR